MLEVLHFIKMLIVMKCTMIRSPSSSTIVKSTGCMKKLIVIYAVYLILSFIDRPTTRFAVIAGNISSEGSGKVQSNIFYHDEIIAKEYRSETWTTISSDSYLDKQSRKGMMGKGSFSKLSIMPSISLMPSTASKSKMKGKGKGSSYDTVVPTTTIMPSPSPKGKGEKGKWVGGKGLGGKGMGGKGMGGKGMGGKGKGMGEKGKGMSNEPPTYDDCVKSKKGGKMSKSYKKGKGKSGKKDSSRKKKSKKTCAPASSPSTFPRETTAPSLLPRGTVTPTIAPLKITTVPVTNIPGMTTAPSLPPGITSTPTIIPGVTTMPALPPGTTATPTVTPGDTEAPSLPPEITSTPTIMPGVTTMPALPPGTTATPTVTPGDTTAPSLPPGITSTPTIIPGVTAMPSLPPGTTATPAVNPGDTTAPSLPPGATTSPTSDKLPSDLPSIIPIPVPFDSPGSTLVPSTPPGVTASPTLSPGLTFAPSLPPGTTAVPTSNTLPSDLPSITPNGGTSAPVATSAPAPSDVGSVPTVVPSNSVQASPFRLTYVLTETSEPDEFEYAAAGDVAMLHLEAFLTEQFSVSYGFEIEAFDGMLSEIGFDPVTIDFEVSISFADDANFLPSPEDIDALIELAFLAPNVDTLVAELNELPDDSPFSTTETVGFESLSSILRDGLKVGTANSENGKHVSKVEISFIVGVSLLLLLTFILFLMWLRSRTYNHNRCSERSQTKSDVIAIMPAYSYCDSHSSNLMQFKDESSSWKSEISYTFKARSTNSSMSSHTSSSLSIRAI